MPCTDSEDYEGTIEQDNVEEDAATEKEMDNVIPVSEGMIATGTLQFKERTC